MKKSTQQERDPRGRKTNPRGKILSNGLFKSQWNKLLELAESRNIGGAVLLREILEVVLDYRIVSEAEAKGLSLAQILSNILEWYYTAKERAEGTYASEEDFKKLKKTKEK